MYGSLNPNTPTTIDSTRFKKNCGLSKLPDELPEVDVSANIT